MPGGELLQRFTPPAIRVVQYAKEEARRFRGSTVGTEHVLLGLIREDGGIAANALERLGVSLGRAQNEVRRQTEMADTPAPAQGSRSWSLGARQVLELALEEARELNPKLGLPNFVETEHLLLGLLREADSTGVRTLQALGVDLERVRPLVIELMGGAAQAAPARRPPRRRTPKTSFDMALVDEIRDRVDATYEEALAGLTEADGDLLRALAAIERARREREEASAAGDPLARLTKLAAEGKLRGVRLNLEDRTLCHLQLPRGPLGAAAAAFLSSLLSQLRVAPVGGPDRG